MTAQPSPTLRETLISSYQCARAATTDGVLRLNAASRAGMLLTECADIAKAIRAEPADDFGRMVRGYLLAVAAEER